MREGKREKELERVSDRVRETELKRERNRVSDLERVGEERKSKKQG